MDMRDRTKDPTNLVFGWMGTICLLAIIAVKLMRFLALVPKGLAIDVAPSILGPAGLIFLFLSSKGRLSKLSLFQVTLLVGVLSVVLELAQLLPRSGALARIRYTFDYLDLGASVISVAAAYAISVGILVSKPIVVGRK